MEEKIKEKLNSKELTFMQLLKMHELAEELAKELNSELPLDEKVALIWQVEISADNEYLGSIVEKAVVEILTNLFIEQLQNMAENATVTFDKKTPLPPKTPPIEKPPPPKKPVVLQKRKTKTQSDGIDLPEGVERV
jgi:hypothetical protein|tara:strand:+ start:318 stop:725 length:408 start_codon:yes stop_codon:yes gene_type:complete